MFPHITKVTFSIFSINLQAAKNIFLINVNKSNL